MSLRVLREVIAHRVPAEARPGAMPVDELRFVIECSAPCNLTGLRAQLVSLLEADQPVVVEPLFQNGAPPLDHFALLRLIGVKRMLTSDVLFEAAYQLADELGAVSVEPDLGSRFYEELPPPVDGRAPEAISRWCNVADEAPADKHWALNLVQAQAAWEADPKCGDSILVAQPDTGVVATHLELGDSALAMHLGLNVLNPDAPPEDPLSPGMSNPGHGTAVASCVVSRVAGGVAGSAPAARVVPIRCIDDVKVFDPAPVARAIEHARASGCHIISMSLGGVPSRALHAAIKKAVEANILVLAAAGNCIRMVVWPARYNECVAVAGINEHRRPWKGSCRGEAVDVSAPAENVWKADPRSDGQSVTPGQGTSFAVAITAGVAALWLAHHGRDQLIAVAQRHGVPLQVLFRSALMQTASRPESWDASEFGAGIVDAARLQALDPNEIRIAHKEIAGAEGTSRDIASLLTELDGMPAGLPVGFDASRYGMELANVLMERARREARISQGAGVEAGTQGYRPSRSLAEALRGAKSSPTLERIADARRENFARPLYLAPAQQRSARDHTLTQSLATRSTSGLESAAPLSDEESIERVVDNKQALMERLLDRIHDGKRSMAHASDLAVVERLESLVRTAAPAAIDSVSRSRTEASLTTVERVSLEALIMLTGRPALPVQNDRIDLHHRDIGSWDVPIALLNDSIPQLTAATGRIDADGAHVGTGFLVADDLVMTNRHVLEAIAVPAPTSRNPQRWILSQPGVSIDFRCEKGSNETRRFEVLDAVFAGPDPTNESDRVDFNVLDAAILRVATSGNNDQTLPAPLRFSRVLNEQLTRELLVIGYPARPEYLPKDAAGRIRKDVVDALVCIFDMQYGVKYLSPGLISAPTGSLSGDGRKWIFGHDATTLPGNSGSCAVLVSHEPGVVGLHFAGDFERSNYAHAISRIATSEHMPEALLERFKWTKG